jgi:hypothetical protein
MKVTPNDIKIFNERYFECKNYSQVARETGFSVSTVRKYVDKNYRPAAKEKIFFRKEDLPEFSTQLFRDVKNFGDLCVMDEEEKKEIHLLWDELSL